MSVTNIYFLKDTSSGNIKIGQSTQIETRKINLQVGNSSPLEFIFILPEVDSNMEAHIHGVCRRFHIQGEWFKPGVIDHLNKNLYYRNNLMSYRAYSRFRRYNNENKSVS